MSELKNLDSAVDSYIKAKGAEDGTFVTGWVLIASISSPEHDSSQSDGYVLSSSDGLPHHAQIGLLNVALDDKRSMAMFNAMSAIAVNFDEDDYDDE